MICVILYVKSTYDVLTFSEYREDLQMQIRSTEYGVGMKPRIIHATTHPIMQLTISRPIAPDWAAFAVIRAYHSRLQPTTNSWPRVCEWCIKNHRPIYFEPCFRTYSCEHDTECNHPDSKGCCLRIHSVSHSWLSTLDSEIETNSRNICFILGSKNVLLFILSRHTQQRLWHIFHSIETSLKIEKDRNLNKSSIPIKRGIYGRVKGLLIQ